MRGFVGRNCLVRQRATLSAAAVRGTTIRRYSLGLTTPGRVAASLVLCGLAARWAVGQSLQPPGARDTRPPSEVRGGPSSVKAVDAEERVDVRTMAILPSRRFSGSSQPFIRIQIRYRNPSVGEVRMVWGLNQFKDVPPSLPPETYLTLNGSHLNTPMQRRGDFFAVELEVPENTRLDYAFMITRTSAGEAVEFWRGANSAGEYYTKSLTIQGADGSMTDPRFYMEGFRSEEWCELQTTSVAPSSGGAGTRRRVIRVRLGYHNPTASEVRLVWGLNQFTLVPLVLPTESFLTLNGSHINTPMTRQDDLFVTEFDVEAGVQLEFAFTITRTSAGEVVELWRGADSTGAYYSTPLTSADEDGVPRPESNHVATSPSTSSSASSIPADVATRPNNVDGAPSSADPHSAEWSKLHTRVVSNRRASTVDLSYYSQLPVHVQFRYHNPLASEVLLVWGLDNWAPVHGKPMPPQTFLTYNASHMNTPMKRRGDQFVVDYEVASGTRIDYAFVIKRTSDGKPAEIWRQDANTRTFYTAVVSALDADELISAHPTLPTRVYWILAISVGTAALFLVRLLVEINRRGRVGQSPVK